MYSTHYSYQILMETEFSSQNFENVQISNFMKSDQWEPNCSMQMDGRMDRHGKVNSHFSQFYKHT